MMLKTPTILAAALGATVAFGGTAVLAQNDQQAPYDQSQYQQSPDQQGPYDQSQDQQSPYQQGQFQQGPSQQGPYEQGPYMQPYGAGLYTAPQRAYPTLGIAASVVRSEAKSGRISDHEARRMLRRMRTMRQHRELRRSRFNR